MDTNAERAFTAAFQEGRFADMARTEFSLPHFESALTRLGYTIVPIAEYERLKARPQMRTVQERPPLTLEAIADAALAQPIPPAAAKLLAERDAGRALYEALDTALVESGDFLCEAVWAALEAYRKVVD